MSMNLYRENLRTAVGASSAPYGYTLATWTSGAVLTHALGSPDTLDVLLFMVGAILGFALVGALALGGIRKPIAGGSRQSALWGDFHFLSVGLAIGAAWLAAFALNDALAWCVGAFSSTATYLLVVGVQLTVAEGPER